MENVYDNSMKDKVKELKKCYERKNFYRSIINYATGMAMGICLFVLTCSFPKEKILKEVEKENKAVIEYLNSEEYEGIKRKSTTPFIIGGSVLGLLAVLRAYSATRKSVKEDFKISKLEEELGIKND